MAFSSPIDATDGAVMIENASAGERLLIKEPETENSAGLRSRAEARVHLAVDQEAKAPPATIINDVGEVAEVQAEAEHEQLLDLRV